MKKTILFSFMLIALSLIGLQSAQSQAFIQFDSTKYGDTIFTSDALSGYEDIYVTIRNRNADSTNTFSFYMLDENSNQSTIGAVDMAGSSTATIVTSITVAASGTKTLKLTPQSFYKLRLINAEFNATGSTNRCDITVRGVKRIQF